MTGRKFIIADVFTEKQFGGNQLAVFLDATGLEKATMQEIAREMNYSETTFLFPPESTGDFRVRIFTPQEELPFAGHPIVGTGNVIVATNLKEWGAPVTNVRLETGVGEIVVTVKTDGGKAGFTQMTQPLPVVRSTWTDVERLARALSLDLTDISSTNLPVQVLFNGLPVLLVPVASLNAVEKVKVDTGALEAISLEAGAITVMTFTLETIASSSSVHGRVFVPSQGIAEDAATGSANGPLGFYLVSHKLVEVQSTTRIISEQGFEMQRPSLIHIEVDAAPETLAVTGIRVGGGVVISGQGEIFI
jgi:trans-2,3-dihydro-3-hydroxyanthranilate isomerase